MLGYLPALILQAIAVIIPSVGIIVLIRKGQGKENTFLVMANAGALMMNWGYMQLLRATDYKEALSLSKFEYIGSVLFYLFFVLFLKSFFLKGRKTKAFTPVFVLFFVIEIGSLSAVLIDAPYTYQEIKVQFREDDGAFFSHRDDYQIDIIDRNEEETDDKSETNQMPVANNQKGYIAILEIHGPILEIRYAFLSMLLLFSLVTSIILAIRRKITEERRKMIYIIGAQFIVFLSLIFGFVGYGTFNLTPFLVSASVMWIICGTASGNFFTITDRGRGWVMDHSENIFIIVDKDYRFLDANEYAKKIFPELVKLPFMALVPENLKRAFMCIDSDYEHDGRSYAKRMAPIEERGKIIGYSIIFVDMTSHYHLMKQLEVERQKAVEANEAKSIFMSNMSHEIRTPMNAIVGMTEIMLRHEQDAFNTEYLNNIKNSGNALLAVVNDILDFSKIESGKLEIIPDDYEIMSVLNDLSMIFLNRIDEKPIELLYDIDPTLPVKLNGDAGRIRQVLLNVVNNGIKYTDEGHVKLSIKAERGEGDLITLLCAVEDTGIGIKEEDLPKLFSTFSQVDTKRNRGKEGTGLGLSIAKQLVEAMDGKFEVESEYGKGSTFRFSLVQRVVDEMPAARIKATDEIYVSGKMYYSGALEMLRKLCDAYSNVHFVEPENVLNKSAKKLDYVFVDRSTYCVVDPSEFEVEVLQHYHPEMIVVHNPMRDRCEGIDQTIMNKPLYTSNFCLAINHEVMTFQQKQEKIMNFKAPEARALIVDDNEMNRKVAEGLLEPIGMQIELAVDGKQAVEKVKANEYDIIFMDHMMPIMDGIEATEAIRSMDGEYFKNVPIIALSANALAEAKEQFKQVGMNDFLAKPIKTKELFSLVKTYLPPDKVQATKESMEQTVASEELPVIEGLDVAAGVENSGGLKLFTSLLGDFYKLIDRKATKIEKCLADGMIRDYTIEVHALKNTARMIGALELSDQFYELEKAGNDENLEFIEAHTQETLSLYRSYKPILKEYAIDSNAQKESVSVEEIKEILERLKASMDEFDLDGADEAMHRLENCQIPENVQDYVEDLGALVADVAMEDVISLCDQILAEL